MSGIQRPWVLQAKLGWHEKPPLLLVLMDFGFQVPGSSLGNQTKLLLLCVLSCWEPGAWALYSSPCPERTLRGQGTSRLKSHSLSDSNISCAQIGDPWANLTWNPGPRSHLELYGVCGTKGRWHFSQILKMQYNSPMSKLSYHLKQSENSLGLPCSFMDVSALKNIS